jgi:hypothetical protein
METSVNLIGLTRKSRENPSAVGQAISSACVTARGVDRTLPVVHGGKVVAFVRGTPGSSVVEWRLPPRGGGAHLWMGYSTYDDIISELSAGKRFSEMWCKSQTTAPAANNWYDLWPVGGNPQAGTYPGAARTAVQWDDTATGAMLHGGNVSPDTKHVLTAYGNSNNITPTLVLYDRVLTYEACTISNGNQVMTNTLTAQRYISGGQPGLKIMVTCQTLLGATANAYTQLQYTDQDGNTLQSMPTSFGVNVIVSAAAPTTTLGARVVSPAVSGGSLTFGPFMSLAAGDTGVRLIDNYTHSANNTGTLAYVLGQPLVYIPVQAAGQGTLADQVQQLANLPRVYDGACLSFMLYAPTATANIVPNGRFEMGWGCCLAPNLRDSSESPGVVSTVRARWHTALRLRAMLLLGLMCRCPCSITGGLWPSSEGTVVLPQWMYARAITSFGVLSTHTGTSSPRYKHNGLE